ncbi:hypothetical protein SCLCIDRAFT_334558 [Scleroderma citrinum Foug A]|uniref:Uncharacterized protein n=1 Tax=Scleroderma citrinum Foug A TaxID=1036808 RepID=A0A0C2YZD4_9AGAM|nr:hypothetical protein SCLCIDRAFT_334558 [Scleroderma citrinum Foug A]
MAVGRSPLGVGKLPCLGHQLPSRHVRRVRGQRNADNSAIAMPALCRHFFSLKKCFFSGHGISMSPCTVRVCGRHELYSVILVSLLLFFVVRDGGIMCDEREIVLSGMFGSMEPT